tara:strand:- start:25526 stop:26677 length:1152 start_codon:yes stop_codon:yes gene_type:complete
MIKRTPSRWGGGVSLLWNGIEAKDVLRNLFNYGVASCLNTLHFEFDSARNGLFHFLRSHGIGKGDTVAVLLFTCDAVTDAILDLGCDIVFYSCDNQLENGQIPETTNFPKVIIEQVTFGRRSLNDEILQKYAAQGSIIIRDKALSYGPKDFTTDATVKYPTLYSFEVSKSLTVGWGGILALPYAQTKEFSKYYNTLRKVGTIPDLYRNIVLYLNAVNIQNGSKVKFLFWILTSALRLKRRSSRSSMAYSRSHSRLGKRTSQLLQTMLVSAEEKLFISNVIHDDLKKHLEENGFQVISRVDVSCSTPRITFICENNRNCLIAKLAEHNVECGTWFDLPPVDQSFWSFPGGWENMFSKYLNLPCHYTLTSEKVSKIKKVINEFAS